MAAAVLDLGMSGRDVCTLVADVRAGAGAVTAALAGGALSDVAEAALPELAVEVAEAIDRLTAAQALIVARVHASGVLRDGGVVSTKAWLATHTRTFAFDAAAAVGRARDLGAPELAPARDAVLSGQVTVAQHRAITRGLRRCERSIRTGPDATLDPATARALLYADGQAWLLAAAVEHGHGPDDLERLAVRLRHLLDPDGTGQSALDADLEACLSIRVVGDMTDVRGCLDLDGGAALTTVLDRTIDGWYRDGTLTRDSDTTDTAGGDASDTAAAAAAASAGRVRRGRRDHDRALALAHLALTLLDEGTVGATHGVRPHLTLTADLADLARAEGSGQLHLPGHGPVDIPITTIARHSCTADITLHIVDRTRPDTAAVTLPGSVTGDPGRQRLQRLRDRLDTDTRDTLWLGRAHRHTSTRLWQYLVARDRHCRAPGCTTDPTRCQPHHVIEWWAHDGPTNPDNLLLLCHHHHRLAHEGGWRITTKPGAPPGHPNRWTFTTRR